ncbi:MAG TPA: hypothetical protein VLZ28_06830 [Daejeonella sp.]|nr:hypothetical protein [Daejeonella sp.]
MKKVFLYSVLVFLFNTVMAQSPGVSSSENNTITKGAAVLFKNVPSKLSVADKNQIFKQLGFALSGDASQPFALDSESKEYPFAVQILPTDMNKDGYEEIFVLYGNSYTSGATGGSVVLFIKNNTGQYHTNLGFPGIPQALPETKDGYNDLLIGGPGFDFPLWRWDGKEYAPYKTVKDSELAKMKVLEISELSKAYTGN